MTDRITDIVTGIKKKHGFEYSESDLLAIKFSLDLLVATGHDEPQIVTQIITESALMLGLRNKYPDIPLQYAFLNVN